MLCSALIINPTKIEYLISQLEPCSFEHGMAELVRLCSASGMDTTKLECLISQLKHDSFEYGMDEFVNAVNSTVPSNMQKLWCLGFSPGSRHSFYLPALCREFGNRNLPITKFLVATMH